MAGHSKWANIKHRKARADAQKGKQFTKLSRNIIVAARNGVPDPEANFQLRQAIEKAKSMGLPNDNIEKAIAKGCGNLEGEQDSLESMRYEGYGPGGVAVLIEAVTDNRNRTAADLRAAFSKNGGNLGETGCVSWMFDQKGVVSIEGEIDDEETLLEASLEGGAESYEIFSDADNPGAEVYSEVENLESLNQTLRDRGYNVTGAEPRWIANHTIEVNEPDQARLTLKLMDALDELDDVQNVTANFEIPNDILVAAG